MNILIAGAHGTVGHSMVKRFQVQPGFRLTTVSRRAEGPAGCRHVPLDLLDEAATRAARSVLEGSELVVFAARAPGTDAREEASRNLAMLRNLITAIDGPGSKLRRVCLIHGTKWYGCHRQPYPVPAREDDPRGPGPLFYFDQYDWLTERRRGRPWDRVTLRPHTVWGYAESANNNLITLVAAYAAIQRERGLALHFPGPVPTYEKRSQATAADLLGQAAVWACTSAQARNRDFNITNGDTFAWRTLWPRIADSFGMQAGEPGQGSFASAFAGAGEVWRALQQKRGLLTNNLADIATPAYGDGLFACTWDDVSSMDAARAAGWTGTLDSESTFLKTLDELRQARIVA